MRRFTAFVFGMTVAVAMLAGCAMEERQEPRATQEAPVGVTGQPIEQGEQYEVPPGPTPGASAVDNDVRGGTGGGAGGGSSEKLGPPQAAEGAAGAPANGAEQQAVPQGQPEAQAPGPAQPQPRPGVGGAAGGGMSGIFEQLDHNSDGVLTPSEVGTDPSSVSMFERADRNHDGILSPDEFWATHQRQ